MRCCSFTVPRGCVWRQQLLLTGAHGAVLRAPIHRMSNPWTLAAKRKSESVGGSAPHAASATNNTPDEPVKKPKTNAFAAMMQKPPQWRVVGKSLLLRTDSKVSGSRKVAAFDLDGTLVDTKSGSKFARDADDWKFFNEHVLATIQKLHADGFHICILSNQVRT